MTSRLRHVVPILAAAVALALLVTAVPVQIATAAVGPKACRVYNVDKGIGRDTLQRAVWAADAGDTLRVRGTCVGTTIIRKNLTIGGVRLAWSGTPILRSGSKLPTLVVDPRVDRFRIRPGLRVQGSVVVADVRSWKRGASASTSPVVPTTTTLQRVCRVQNLETEARYGRMQVAVDAASPGDRLFFTGKCWGGTTIDKRLHIRGGRIKASSIECGPTRCSEPHVTDTGVPVITEVTVASGVDGVTLKSLTLPKGFAVR